MQQVRAEHLQQEQVRQLLPDPGAALQRGPRGQQGHEDRQQVRLLVGGAELGRRRCRRIGWNGKSPEIIDDVIVVHFAA